MESRREQMEERRMRRMRAYENRVLKQKDRTNEIGEHTPTITVGELNPFLEAMDDHTILTINLEGANEHAGD